MKKPTLYLLVIFSLLLTHLVKAQQGPCYSGRNTQTKGYTEYLPSIINPLIQSSNTSPLKIYDKKIRVQFSWETATVNFLAPAYFDSDGSNKVLEIYYTNGVGPTVNLHQYPIAKVFDWYGIPSSYPRMDEHYLEFFYSVNSGNQTPAVTVTPQAGMTYNIKQLARIFRHHFVRQSTNGFCANYTPTAGDFFEGKYDGTTHQFEEFTINSVEADFTNLLEGTYLKFCREDQQIDLYDYFTDQNNVSFEILDSDNNAVSSSSTVNLNDLEAGNYKIRASKSYANGDFTKTIDLVIVNLPSAEITTSIADGSLSFCEDQTVRLSAPEAPNGETYTYRWSSGETSRTITIDNTWEGTVTVSNGFCETVSTSTKVTMNEAPKPTIQNQSGGNNICDGENAILVTNAIGDAYIWENEDGDIVGDQQAFYATEAGTYKVTVVYPNGCHNTSDPITITVNPNPIPTITPTGETEFCEGESVQLTASLPNGQIASSYLWSNGETGQTITVTEAGIYTVTARNTNGCERISEPIIIETKPNPKPEVSASGALEFCDGGNVKLTVTNTQGSTGVVWSNGDSTNNITVTESGTYYVTVFRDDCSNTSEQIDVTVHPNVTPTIQALGDSVICEGETVKLQVTNPQPNTTYTWSNGETGLEMEASSTGQYYVIAENEFCSSNSTSIPVVVNPIQTPEIMANGITEFCEGGSVTLTVTNASDQDDIVWSNGETTRSITVTNSGRYYATISKNNCQRTSEYIDVTVFPNPKPTIEALGATEICQGETVTLQVSNPQPNTTYTWSNGETGLQTEVSATGNYYVISSSEGSCMRNSDAISISVNPIQKPEISLSSSPTFCEGGSVTLTVTNPTGADEIRWSNGEIGTSITVTEEGNYYAVLKKGNCERISDEIVTEVVPNVKPIIEAMGSETICEGQTVTLQVTNPQPNATYLWSDGTEGRQATVSTSGNYFVTSQNGNDCSRTSEPLAINVLPIAKPTISIDNETTICQGDSIVLTINESGSSYRWSNGETTKSITVKNSGNYIAYISNGECERASEPINVTVNPNTKIAVSQLGETEFCEGDSLVLSVINDGTYLWNTGETTRSIKITKSGSYSVMVTNDFDCISESEVYDVTVHPLSKPTINITGQTTLCEGDSVVLTINETADSYRWSNGETTKSITVESSGTYTAYIGNEFGCERSSEPISVTVNPNPTPQINIGGKTEFCETDSVRLYVTPIAGMTYTWSNGETGSSITVKNSGEYYVSSTNESGCISISETVNVTVHPLPKPTIQTSGVTEFCEGDSVVLTINETADSYRWSNGETTKSITVESSGTYTAYIGNEFGCERSSEPISVTVNPNPTPQINIGGQTEFCETDSVRLYVTPIAGMTYTWSNGETGSSITVKNSGNYYVSSTNQTGCISISETVNVTVHPLPKPTLHISGETTFCEGDSIVLTINETADSYRWSNGETTKSITVKTGASYIGYITNEFGCERASDPVDVTVHPNPKPTISYASLVACEGDSVKLTASNGESYLWSNGETTKDIYVKYPSSYSVIVTNENGCSNVSDTVAVDILPNDVPTITSSNGTNLCEGESTTLTASKGAFYLWNTGETTQSIEATKGGKYWVTVTNDNGCSRTSTEHELIVHSPLELNRIPDQQICINGGKLNLDEINTNELGGVYEGEGVTYNTFDPNQVGEGVYKITYTFTTEFGCISSTEFTIEVVPIEVLEVGEDIEVCLNADDILLQVEGLPVGVTFEGNGVTGNLFKPEDAGVGIHEILYTYSNNFGCISTARRIITVTPVPTAPEVSGNNPTCNNNAITLLATSSILDNSPITYNWYREGEEEPFDTGQQIRYIVTKNEKIYVEAISNKGCPSERTEVVITSYTPEVRLTASATTIAQGSSVQFTLQDLPTSNPSVRWEYDFGDGFRSTERNPLHYYNKAGVYTVRVKAYSEQDCFVEIIEIDFIVVEENPIVIDPPITGEEPIEDTNPFYKTIVYPNPIKVGEQALVRVFNNKSGSAKATLQVYTISGTPIFEQYLNLATGQNEIPVENLDRLMANTYYLFVVKFDDGRAETIKVLIL
ncbi:PKD domain-containing protein [Sphingobacterium sp. JB170]|uniref:Ig-like domain-containing protein n=1 Tax=Sphingobacterium sp. JB170 TaxID=1434842 RepID=UPI00097EE627|nr:PKD domain-containing protein [Sphingobacterium sp. JB170]SJN26815.1 internalin, putative [Sphingobacterium sp. JB170]